MVECEPRSDVVALAAAAFLCVFGCLWLGADLHPSLVASLLVQHSLRHGDVADLRRFNSVAYGRAAQPGTKIDAQSRTADTFGCSVADRNRQLGRSPRHTAGSAG